MPDEEPPLKRESAGRYRTRDGRFEVEQNSGRWLVLDTEQADELGLPLVRGPFTTLDEAREAILTARTGPAPASPLGARAKRAPRKAVAETTSAPPSRPRGTKAGRASEGESREVEAPAPPPLVIRRLEPGDGRILRRLSEDAKSFEADDRAPLEAAATRRFLAQPGIHLLVALEGEEPLGFVLAHELLRRSGDERARLFVHEVRVRTDRRREAIGERLLEALWAIGRERGITGAFAIAATGDRDALAFYRSVGGKRSRREVALIRFSTEES